MGLAGNIFTSFGCSPVSSWFIFFSRVSGSLLGGWQECLDRQKPERSKKFTLASFMNFKLGFGLLLSLVSIQALVSQAAREVWYLEISSKKHKCLVLWRKTVIWNCFLSAFCPLWRKIISRTWGREVCGKERLTVSHLSSRYFSNRSNELEN